MKTIELKIDTAKLNLNEVEKNRSSVEIISAVIQNVILSYAQQARGFDEKERRIYYKISDALENATKNNSETIDLDDEYIGFIRKCFRESKLVPNLLLKGVEEIIANIKDR